MENKQKIENSKSKNNTNKIKTSEIKNSEINHNNNVNINSGAWRRKNFYHN